MKEYLRSFQKDLVIASSNYGFSIEELSSVFNIQKESVRFILDNTINNYPLVITKKYIKEREDRLAKNKIKEPIVYFIQQVNGEKLIKIGYTNSPIEDRLRQLEAGYPHKLKVLNTIKGSYSKENSLHHKFGKYRIINTEWFLPSKELLKFINEVEK